MKNLPLEVFSHIVSYLTSGEKVKLLIVCRSWLQNLRKTNLYDSLVIKGSTNCDMALEFFEKDGFQYRKQVKSLKLIRHGARKSRILSVPSYFPLLDHFAWTGFVDPLNRIVETLEDYNNAHNDRLLTDDWAQIRWIEETSNDALLPFILRTNNSFHKLTKIKMDLQFSKFGVDDFIKNLNHAPLLNTLKISGAKMSLIDLEDIHDNAPNLHTLYLSQIRHVHKAFDQSYNLSRTGSVDLLVIKPAQKLVNLHFQRDKSGPQEEGLEEVWMMYIAEKYINMKEFIVDGVKLGYEPRPYYQYRIAKIAETCPSIQTFQVSLCPLNMATLEVMDQAGTRLKKVAVYAGEISTAVEQIDFILQSAQVNTIESLYVRSKPVEFTPFFERLANFHRLKNLSLDFTRGSTSLKLRLNIALITKLKSLESLTVSYCDIDLSRLDSSAAPNLKSLVLKKVMICSSGMSEDGEEYDKDKDVFDFISRFLPNLSRLQISGQVEDPNHPVKLCFPPEQYFSLIKVSILGNTYYKINHYGSNSTTWYSKPSSKPSKILYSSKLDNVCTLETVHELENQFHVLVAYNGHSQQVV